MAIFIFSMLKSGMKFNRALIVLCPSAIIRQISQESENYKWDVYTITADDTKLIRIMCVERFRNVLSFSAILNLASVTL